MIGGAEPLDRVALNASSIHFHAEGAEADARDAAIIAQAACTLQSARLSIHLADESVDAVRI